MKPKNIFLIAFFCFFLLLTGGAHVIFDTGKTRIDFDIALHQVRGEARGEFFFDTGKGFSEFESVKFRYYQAVDNRFKHYSLYLPTRKIIQKIRFDPLPKQGGVTIKNIVVQKRNNPVLSYSPLQNPPVSENGIHSLDASGNSLTIIMDREDPHLVLFDNLASYTENRTRWFSGYTVFSGSVLLLILAVCSCFLAGGVFWTIQNYYKNTPRYPVRAFVVLGIFFGLLLVIATPPFQVPDEASHYYRAYQLTELKIKAEKRSQLELGGFLPEAVTMMPPRADKYFQESQHVITFAGIRKMLALHIDSEKRLFMPFGNTTVYTPVSYLPQVAGMLLGRLFDVSALQLMYLGRICNLLAWVVLVASAIRIVPAARWLMLCLALLPMGLYEAASLAADAVTNGLAFLLIAMTLRFRFIDRPLFFSEKFVYFFLTVLLMLSKFAYLPMVLLTCLIQSEKFGGIRQYALFVVLLAMTSFAAVLTWLWYISDIHVAFSPDNCADPAVQLQFILQRPFQYCQVIINTILQDGMDFFVRQFIGVLSQLTLKLPGWVYCSSFLVLGFLAVHTEQEKCLFTWKNRLLLVTVLMATIVLIFTMIYMNFNAPESRTIIGLQGRYLVPLGPLFFMLFRGKRVFVPSSGQQVALLSHVSLVLIIAICTLVERYYLLQF